MGQVGWLEYTVTLSQMHLLDIEYGYRLLRGEQLGTGVEHLSPHPKVKALSLANTAESGRESLL
jgi:hypothetical protein